MMSRLQSRVAGVALAVLAVVGGAFFVSTVPGVRSGPGFDPLLDGWLQGGAYVLCALVALLRPVSTHANRRLWWWVAAATGMRALAFVGFLGVVRNLDPLPYPSVSDAGWLLSSVLLMAALGERFALEAPRLTRTMLLDALLGALTVAAVAVALLYKTLVALTRPGTPAAAVTTNLAYPILDVALLVLVVGLLACCDWRLRASDWALSAGVAGLAVVDCVFLYEVSAGTYRPGTVLAALSLAATAAIASSGWARPARSVVAERTESPPTGVGVPAALALLCVLTLVYAGFVRVPLGGILLAAAGLLTAISRALTTIWQERSEAQVELQAKNEERLRFQALVEASGDFIAIAGTDGKVLYVNPAGRAMVGFAPDADVTRTTIADYLTEEGQRASLEVEQPAVIAHGRWEGESTLLDRRGGPPIPVTISSFLMFHPDTGEPFALATVQRDITERLAAQRSLQELADQRQQLLGRLVQAQEGERRRIAEDVHDDSVQALAAVELRLGVLQRSLAVSNPEQTESIDAVRQSVSGATARLRHLLFDLESPALRTNLANALGEAAAYVFEDTEVHCSVAGDPAADLPEAARVTAYRIAKEAMVNSLRHAEPRQVQVGLERRDGGVQVTVRDDGKGFDAARDHDRPGHLGLSSIHDRASIAGGWVRVESQPGAGTEVRLWLPDH